MSYLGEFEQLILFSVLRLGDDAYGVSIREAIEERTGRVASSGAIYTTLGRLEGRGLVTSRSGTRHRAVRPAEEVLRAEAGGCAGADGRVRDDSSNGGRRQPEAR